MVAAGFTVCFLDGFRSTPELSLAVRRLVCQAGIMVSASHNPPQDNAVKVFGPSGGQLRPPDDERLTRTVAEVSTIGRADFAEAARRGQIVFCQEEIDRAYQAAVLAQSFAGPRDLHILFSPLHGVGTGSVLPVLEADGFSRVDVYERQATPDGDFPNVPNHVANPENPAVFDELMRRGRRAGGRLRCWPAIRMPIGSAARRPCDRGPMAGADGKSNRRPVGRFYSAAAAVPPAA